MSPFDGSVTMLCLPWTYVLACTVSLLCLALNCLPLSLNCTPIHATCLHCAELGSDGSLYGYRVLWCSVRRPRTDWFLASDVTCGGGAGAGCGGPRGGGVECVCVCWGEVCVCVWGGGLFAVLLSRHMGSHT